MPVPASVPSSPRRPLRIVMCAVLLLGALMLLLPGVREALLAVLAGDRATVRSTLLGLGAFGPPASIALNIAQAVIAPAPGFVVPYINGVVFGTWFGALLSWVGGVGAAATCFAIARTIGGGFAERMCRASNVLHRANATLERHGLMAVVLARLLPGMPFDAFSYLGGLARLRFRTFILGTAIGSAPHAYLYALMGDHLALPVWLGMLIAPALGLALAGGRWAFVVLRRRLVPTPLPAPTGA